MSKRNWSPIWALLALLLACPARALEPLVLSHAETAQIDGRDWERTGSGGTSFDAVHRRVLLRFPTAAEAIKARLDTGLAIEKAVVTLDYVRHETRPSGYTLRDGLGAKLWAASPPRWHVIAHALRQPWSAHGTFGPTSRYRVRLLHPWAKVGAVDPELDRHPEILGPAELSESNRQSELDVTRLLTGTTSAPESGARLRAFADNGLILSKAETYDMRYRPQGDIYEWAIATGGHALTFSEPRLVVTFRPAPSGAPLLDLPPRSYPAEDAVKQEASALKRSPDMLPSAQLQAMARQIYETRPSWLSAQQFRNLGDLLRAGGDAHTRWLFDLQFADLAKYRQFLRETLATVPRYWKGWGIAEDLQFVLQLGAFAPPHVRDHLAEYWRSYLMPDLPTSAFFVPHSREAGTYWAQTGDWRGRTSFFRDGYNYVGSTQNFNFTASMGALLGGAFIGSEAAMADGRHGLERLLLRYWTALDGGTQELVDPYYLSITLSAVKMLADHAPTAYDRLIARIILERTMEMLATAYHPTLRRIVAAAGRARLSGLLTEQDGIYGALHVLSERGALLYPGRPSDARILGMPVWGYDFPPGRVGLQSLTSPWAPSWFKHVVDNKMFPFRESSTNTVRGHFNPPLRRSTYLDRHFGLASQDIKGGMADVVGQWSRTGKTAGGIEHLGLLTVRPCVNICNLAASSGGEPIRAGSLFTVQHDNKAIIFAKPPTRGSALQEQQAGAGDMESIGSVLGLWMMETDRNWRLFVNGQERQPSDLPLTLQATDIVVLQDGPTLLAIRPIAVPDDRKIVLALGGFGGTPEAGRSVVEPTLTLANMHRLQGPAISRKDYDQQGLGRALLGGFTVEFGDIDRFGNVAGFVAHLSAGSLGIEHVAPERVRIRYATGGQTLEAVFSTAVQELSQHFPIAPGTQTAAIESRSNNGASLLPPPGIERDTSWSQQSATGRIEKNGVVLETDPGRMVYLIVEPSGRGALAYNLTPDPTDWRLILPGGREIVSTAKVSLLRIEIDPLRSIVEIEHATPPNASSVGPDPVFILKGFDAAWTIRAASGTSRVD